MSKPMPLSATRMRTTSPAFSEVMRTRGGVASVLNELARSSGVAMVVQERAVPVLPAVAGAAEILGIDPMYVANEGKLVAFVAADDAEAVLGAMHAHPLGASAAVIGRCVHEHPGMVVARTGLGGMRVVDLPIGEQLPRIC